jgi:hypothetical protein
MTYLYKREDQQDFIVAGVGASKDGILQTERPLEGAGLILVEQPVVTQPPVAQPPAEITEQPITPAVAVNPGVQI